MKSNNFSLEQYLRRIGFDAPLSLDIECLAAVMRCQLFSIPFENLDVLSGAGISLNPEDIVKKLLGRGRGGYCYELNGLFGMFLDSLSVDYHFVAARPMFYPMRRPRTHMAIVAEVRGRSWLFDLGFGSYGVRAPLALDQLDVECRQDEDTFRLALAEDGDFLLQAKVAGEWSSQYAFADVSAEWIDFYPANYLNSNHPDTIFVQKPVLIIHRPEGRDMLVGSVLKNVRGGQFHEREIMPEEYEGVLKQVFGIDAFKAA